MGLAYRFRDSVHYLQGRNMAAARQASCRQSWLLHLHLKAAIRRLASRKLGWGCYSPPHSDTPTPTRPYINHHTYLHICIYPYSLLLLQNYSFILRSISRFVSLSLLLVLYSSFFQKYSEGAPGVDVLLYNKHIASPFQLVTFFLTTKFHQGWN